MLRATIWGSAFLCLVGLSGCSSGYEVEYPKGARFCVIKSYGDELHPQLAASFRDALYESNAEFQFAPEDGCDGRFVISTTYSSTPPASCVERANDAMAAGSGLIVGAIVEAACKSYRAQQNVVYTEVFVIEKNKGWKVDARLFDPIERDADGTAPGRAMAVDLVDHLKDKLTE
ncbi:MAG: hypothetical protein HOW73_42325 [Polyangiaceae bacterium]|nr:hypothetical protein [Polyangiaceae bacterium]